MKYNPKYHHRRSIHLPEYDYSQSGIYFLTICTYKKQCLFGEIHQRKMLLNQIGKIVAQEWLKSADIRQELRLDEWIIMPNHLHGIVVITNDDEGAGVEGASLAPLQQDKSPQGRSMQRKPRSLSTFVWGFKSSVTKRIKNICVEDNPCVWPKNP
ncbi:MAG: transposase [Xenococcaceae cyanobacterium MO_188.B32]|nr:transposase [Xenococcaceae cyanobacterium MO_188.B32]